MIVSLPDRPFESRSALVEWLTEGRLVHLARFNLEVLAPSLEPSRWAELRAVSLRRHLIELGSADRVEKSLTWLPPSPFRETLLPLVWRYLHEEPARIETAREELHSLLVPPSDPRAASLCERLVALRRTIPDSIAPRPLSDLGREPFRALGSLPGFEYTDTRPYEVWPRPGGRFLRPKVRLITGASEVVAECSCGANGACIHVLGAIDAGLVWLHHPIHAKMAQSLEELSRPAWERTLTLLDRALEGVIPGELQEEVTWRIHVRDPFTVEVSPWVLKAARKGVSKVATRMSRKRLSDDYGARLLPEDARILALLPDDGESATRPLLEALADHPRVVVRDLPERRITIERAHVGLVAEERSTGVRISAGIDGSTLPPMILERIRRGEGSDVLFVWDGARLTLLDLRPEIAPLLAVLHKNGDMFPPESHTKLLGSLARWSSRVPVAMPRTVMGEAIASRVTMVLRLELQVSGEVEIEIKVRPLEDGPSLLPGFGPPDLHIRRGEKALHAKRDFSRETKVTGELVFALGLEDAEALDDPYHYRLPSAESALSLLDLASHLPVPPELEWVGPQIRHLGAAGVHSLRVSMKRKSEWFGVLGELSVGGETVELARLLDTVRKKERYLKVSSHSYVELSDVLRQTLLPLADHSHPSRQGLTLGAGGAWALRGLAFDGGSFQGDDVFRELTSQVARAETFEPELPGLLRAELRPYQEEGYRFLCRLAAWGAGAVLADDMGLGKTVQTLALLLQRAPLGPALVVAPTSVAFNWKDEAQRFAPSLRLVLYASSNDRTALLHALAPGDVLVVSYGLLVRDALPLAKAKFATLVFDEAQSLKNGRSLRSRAARMLDGDFRVALSGTPMENQLSELWSVFAVVFPGLLGSWDSFRERFAQPIERRTNPFAGESLARVIRPFLLRRTKAEVETELPTRTDVRVPVVLSTAEWQLYEDARLSTLSDLESAKSVLKEQQRKVEVLAALTRLRLLSCHPRLYDKRSVISSSKLTRLLELVEELTAEGQRALVFSQFTSHLALVVEALREREIDFVYLDGQTPEALRRTRVGEFQNGHAPLFLISLKAGGFGLNLTAASNVIHLDPWWNPAVEDQASDRAHRPGQTQPVTVYRLVTVGTIEEQMLELHERKRALVTHVIEGADGAMAASASELLGLLTEGSRRSRSTGRTIDVE